MVPKKAWTKLRFLPGFEGFRQRRHSRKSQEIVSGKNQDLRERSIRSRVFLTCDCPLDIVIDIRA